MQVYRRGSARAFTPFVLHWRGNGGRVSHFGFSVSKKVGTAVVRNRVKRRFRHAVFECMADFPAGYNYIFVVRACAAQMSYAELLEQVRRAADSDFKAVKKRPHK